MKFLSQDLARFLRPLTKIALCAPLILATINLATTISAQAASIPTTQIKTTQSRQEVIQVSLLDIFLFPVVKFLNANGNVAPKPSAYAPEHGDPGYLDTYYGKVDPQGKRTTLNAWLEEMILMITRIW